MLAADRDPGEIIRELTLILPDITDRAEMSEITRQYHPADIAEALDTFPTELQARLIGLMQPEDQGDVFDEITDAGAGELAEQMSDKQLSEIIAEMPPDDAAYFLDGLDDEKAAAVLAQVGGEESAQIREILSYPADSAGRLMNNDFFAVPPQITIAEVHNRWKEIKPDSDDLPAIVVCRDDRKLLGLLAPEDSFGAASDTLIDTLMERAPVNVGPFDDQEVCARYMKKYNLDVLPVIDPHRRVLGLISMNDILDVVEEEAEEDMFRMAGIEERPLDEGTLTRALKRMPWFVVTIVNMSLLGLIIRSFQVTIEQVVAVSFFIPAIMGLCGNIGVQAATITVRGLASGEIVFTDTFWILRRELLVGALIGVFCGVVLSGVSALMPAKSAADAAFVVDVVDGVDDVDKVDIVEIPIGAGAENAEPQLRADKFWGFLPRFPLAVALAMFMGALGAVALGTCVPMLCQRCKIDPAIASGPFVTTIVDIGTQTLYLSLVTWLMLIS